MYDFYFGKKSDIDNDPKKFLLTIKRMMPRWCNSIPDSEYLALYDVLAEHDMPDAPVLVETGCGASTIILCYFALKHIGELYTWDINGNKLSYMRGIINDTLMKHFDDKNLHNHWKHIAYSSNSVDAGIPVIGELGKRVSACFLDSEHTLEVLMQEVRNLAPLLTDEAVVAIDDANYAYKYRNTAYANMIRMKLGLPPVQESEDNKGRHFWEEVSSYLKENFQAVEYIDDSYKKTYQADLFWSYFKNDRAIMSDLDMEKTADLDHRFDAWKVKR